MPIKFTPWFLISVGLVDLLFFNHQRNLLVLGFVFIAWGGFLLLLPHLRKGDQTAPRRTVMLTVKRPATPALDFQRPVAEELAKLGILRDRGVLTEAEFQAQKKKLLGEP